MGIRGDGVEAKENISCTIVDNVPSHVSLDANEQLVFLKNGKYHSKEGIAGILSHPKSMQYDSLSERLQHQDDYGLPQHRLVLLVHGHQSHKNATYQPLLAAKLSKLGYFVLRIDFRGMGDSEDNRDATVGRSIQQDVEDVATVYDFVNDKVLCERVCGMKLSLDTIVAHSRGVLAMFEFARAYPEKHVANLVNSSGRFDGQGLLHKRLKNSIEWRKEGGFWCDLARHGTTVKSWIPKAETLSAINLDTKKFSEISSKTWVLSCYGSEDSVIPSDAAGKYSNLFCGRHTLEIVPGADHNYYGLPADPNPLNLPFRKGLVNYCYVLVDKISDFLSWENQLDRFYKKTKYILGASINPADISPRWPLPYDFSKISNFRDLGGYSTMFHNRRVKTCCIYRCANPCDITKEAEAYFNYKLNIKRVFDLRSSTESVENGVISIDIPNLVENISFNSNASMSPDVMAEHYQGLLVSSYSFPKAYMIVLRNSLDSIRKFFQYILAGSCHSKSALVFHCTAGKDRTGILGMLLLSILGVDDDTIAKDYELTTIGLKTEVKLLKKLEARGDLYYTMLGKDSERLTEMYKLTPEKMCKTLLSSRYEAMRWFIDDFNEKYKSVEHFFLNELHFSLHDIGKLRDILLE